MARLCCVLCLFLGPKKWPFATNESMLFALVGVVVSVKLFSNLNFINLFKQNLRFLENSKMTQIFERCLSGVVGSIRTAITMEVTVVCLNLNGSVEITS